MQTITVLFAIICGSKIAGSEALNNLTYDVLESLTITVSPKILNLLETKAKLITNTVKHIQIPAMERKVSRFMKYKIYDGHFDEVSIPEHGLSLVDKADGIRIKAKNISFVGTFRARFEIRAFFFPFHVTGLFKISSTDAEIDISLTWTGFSFKPEISLNSNLRLDLAKHPKRLILVRKKVQRIARKEFEGKIREALTEVIQEELNPRLKKLNEELTTRGVAPHNISWSVQNRTLRVVVNWKRASGFRSIPIKRIDKIVCLEIKKKSLTSSTSGIIRTAVNKLQDFKELWRNMPVVCVSPIKRCNGLLCSYCTDVAVLETPVKGHTDFVQNCTSSF